VVPVGSSASGAAALPAAVDQAAVLQAVRY
jgi:hypothetical protein